MVAIRNGFVTYCKHLKYLGLCVSYNLRDNQDVDMRIASARKMMGALKFPSVEERSTLIQNT